MITMLLKVQQGFSLITAIFLLVVLAGLGAMMVPFFAAQQQSSALDVMGSQAYQVARTGILWGTYQITHSGVAGGTFASDCNSGTNLPNTQPNLTGTSLSSFSLAINCTATSSVVDSSMLYVYSITAKVSGVNGSTPGNPDYVERDMQATISVSGVDTGIIYQRESY